jgi:hypothetical protein
LDHEGLVDTGFQHFEHLGILHVVADMLEDVAVGYYTESAKDYPDGNVDLDVRDGGFD